MSPETIFYVYEHIRPDTGDVFYVGKGKGRRANDFRNRGPHHKNITAKLRKLGLSVEIRIIAANLTEANAFVLERECIAFWREFGSALINYTDGGEGTSGSIVSCETRAKISAVQRSLHGDPVFAAKHAERMRMLHSDPVFTTAHAERGKERMRKLWADPKFVERRRAANADPILTAKKAERMRAMRADPIRAVENAERTRMMHRDPVFAAKRDERMRKMNADPEFIAKKAERMRAMRADPAFIARNNERLRAMNADPEFIIRRTAKLVSYYAGLPAKRKAKYEAAKRDRAFVASRQTQSARDDRCLSTIDESDTQSI